MSPQPAQSSAPLSTPSASTTPRAQVAFHFGVDHRLHYACRLLRKVHGTGKTVLALCSDTDRLARLDAALWTFSALDFLPHVYAESGLATVTPIVLAQRADLTAPRDVLLALDDRLSASFVDWLPHFEHILEVVSCDDDDRSRARVRFKAYREAGCHMTSHSVGAA